MTERRTCDQCKKDIYSDEAGEAYLKLKSEQKSRKYDLCLECYHKAKTHLESPKPQNTGGVIGAIFGKR